MLLPGVSGLDKSVHSGYPQWPTVLCMNASEDVDAAYGIAYFLLQSQYRGKRGAATVFSTIPALSDRFNEPVRR